MERETGFEPATSSLGKRLSIGNKEHSVFGVTSTHTKNTEKTML